MRQQSHDKGMDLRTACRIGVRPGAFRPRLWERTLRILMRWAGEPCVRKEFDKRIALCRKVHVALQEWTAKLERLKNRKWKFKARMHSEPSAKAGVSLRQMNGKNGLAHVSKGTVRTSRKTKRTLASQATRLAKPRGKTSVTSRALAHR